MRRTCENVAANVYIISAIRDQLRPSFRCNSLTETLVVAQPADYKKSGGEITCSSLYKNCEIESQIQNYLTRDHSYDIIYGCGCEILKDISYSSTSFYVNMNDAVSHDVLCEANSEKRLDKSNVKRLENRCFNTFQIEECELPCPKILVPTPVQNNAENYASCNMDTHDKDRETLGVNQTAQFANTQIESKSIQRESECNSKRSFSKQRSRTIAVSSLKQTSSSCGKEAYTQPELQACRSSVSVNPRPLTDTCSTADLNNRVKHSEESSIKHSHITNVQSLMNLFDSHDKQHEIRLSPKGMINYLSSKVPNLPSSRVKKKTSSTIQRIQEQLLLKMENDKKKFRIVNVPNISANEQYPNIESKEQISNVKGNFTYTDRLQKQEKPYRQWQRVSRVVTADSKFIISPKISSQVFSGVKVNTDTVNQQEELIVPEVDHKTSVATINSVSSESINGSLASSCCSGMFKTELLGGKTEFEKLHLKNSAQVNEQHVSLIGEEKYEDKDLLSMNCDIVSSSHSKIIGETSIDCTQNVSTTTRAKKNNLEKSDAVSLGPVVLCNKVVTDITIKRVPTCVMVQSIPLQKSLTHRTLHMSRYQSLTELDEVVTSDSKKHSRDYTTSNMVTKIKPLSAVSGVSQVTGPSFSERKNEFVLEVQSKKYANAGPKLRTAERSRNRGKSPAPTASYLNKSSATNNQTAFCKEPRSTVRNASRTSSRVSRHVSHSFSSDRNRQVMEKSKPKICTKSNGGHNAGAVTNDKDCLECINRNWSSGNAIVAEPHKESIVTATKTNKVNLVDVASKILGLRVPWNEPVKKYLDVEATQDYTGSLPGQLSFRRGQKIKQRFFKTGTSDGMSYGYYRVGRLRKKRKGLFPSMCVTAESTDGVSALDRVSLTSSSKSTY